MTSVRAQLFDDDGDQCVLLPDDFRFPGDEVSIRIEGDAVIIEPVRGEPGQSTEDEPESP